MSEQGWIISFPSNRQQAEALNEEHPDLVIFDPAPVLVALEEDEDADQWRIDVYTDGPPDGALVNTILRLLNHTGPTPKAQPLPDEDWVTLSQQGLEPVRAGRFYVHTSNDAPDPTPGITNFQIDASQAFGTGHHDTTAGCMEALDRLKQQGVHVDNLIDIGTGTGLLAFAAMTLWPRAVALATDIDPVSVAVTADNARINGFPLGTQPGEIALVVSDGTQHPLIGGCAPYDLVIANILAGPLITLAPAIASIIAPGGKLILAGLLDIQQKDVIRAYRRQRFRLDAVGPGEWPSLTFTMRHRSGLIRPIRSSGSAGLPPGDFGTW